MGYQSHLSWAQFYKEDSPGVRLATFWQPSCFSCAKIFHIAVIVGEAGLTSQVIISEKEHLSIQIFVNHLLRSQYLSSFFSACFVGTPWPLDRYSRESIQIELSQKRTFFIFWLHNWTQKWKPVLRCRVHDSSGACGICKGFIHFQYYVLFTRNTCDWTLGQNFLPRVIWLFLVGLTTCWVYRPICAKSVRFFITIAAGAQTW